jgi:DNA-binding XRE family transcriptional regulator
MNGGVAMGDVNKHREQSLQEPVFAEAYEPLCPAYEMIQALISARTECHMTQKELSEKTGIRQSNISRIESGNTSPTMDTLARLAEGMGKKLHIEFQ